MRHAHAFGAGAILAALAAGLIVWLVPLRPVKRDYPLQEPEGLPQAARTLLHERMQRHGEVMQSLVRAVVLVDADHVISAADAILHEPRLARPVSQDATELNTRLPAQFFALQDELRARAQTLRDAAAAHDSAKMVTSAGALAETCATCHRLYRDVK